MWTLTLILVTQMDPTDLARERVILLAWNNRTEQIRNDMLEATRKIFAGELARGGVVNVIETSSRCGDDLSCLEETARKEQGRFVIGVDLVQLSYRKYFFDLRLWDQEEKRVVYRTQYAFSDIADLERAARVLARALLSGRQADEILAEGWKKKPKMGLSIRGGYNYFVGPNSYRRWTDESRQFAEPEPRRAFNFDVVFTYFMGERWALDMDFRIELIYRGLQFMLPVNYYAFRIKSPDMWVFGQAGPLFGFGPTLEKYPGDFWRSGRDGFGFLVGVGAVFFPSYDLSVVGNLRYTYLDNPVGDQGITLSFGLMWSPMVRES